MELLLKNGSDISIVNNNGETAEKLAMEMNVKNLLQMHKISYSRRNTATFSPEEYADDDDSD